MKDSINILLATFNGEKYLSDQIKSIVDQDYKDWYLLIRDDGSNDSTLSIINDFARRFPNRISVINEERRNLGPVGSFFALMEKSTSPYIAFCDQDDIWETDKLSKQLDAVQKAEMDYGKKLPLLVHSDLKVVDGNLNLISNSLWKYQKLFPPKMTVTQRLLVQNCITGCTVLANQSLVDLALKVKNTSNLIMHDWWLALIASVKGKIVSMPEQTVYYRQHAQNDIGAKKWGVKQFSNYAENSISQLRLRLLATKQQANELLVTDILDPNEVVIIKQYVQIFGMGWIQKRLALIKYGFFKYGVLRNIVMFLVI